MKISVPAIAMLAKRYTQPLSPDRVPPKIGSSLSLFVLWLVRHILLFFLDHLSPTLIPLTNAASGLSTL